MVSKVRTIDFLPDIFKTKTNEQFLSASLDQLVQQPNYNKIQGYIGAKFGYGVSSGDTYITEPSKNRTDYQLEPAIVFNKAETSTPYDALTYTGLLEAAALQGSQVKNNNSLFKSEFYSWDSFCDLDKIVNYSHYYWLPNGPDAVTITAEVNLETATFGVISEPNTYRFTLDDTLNESNNPVLTLVRGGTYTFTVDQSSGFYIQTMPGIDGVNPGSRNVSTRDVFGVNYNGGSNGVVEFKVPLRTAQDEYIYPEGLTVDIATTLNWDEIEGVPLYELEKIDGLANLIGKTIIFYGQSSMASGFIGGFYGMAPYDDYPFEDGYYTNINSWSYEITQVGDPASPIIKLVESKLLPTDGAITVRSGDTFATRKFVRNTINEIVLLPLITATMDSLYYQDSIVSQKMGVIKLVDPQSLSIDVSDIIGSPTYQSPTGIKLTNGLKIQFDDKVIPSSYSNGQYYVEGVGTSINLIPTTDFLVTEPFSVIIQTPFDEEPYDTLNYGEYVYLPTEQDYITINRNCLSKNAWARSNRWFHEDVVKTSIENNVLSPLSTEAFINNTRAKRPIIEFYPNLKLFNQGTSSKKPVDFVNFSTTNAFTECNGQTTFAPDGASTGIFEGCRIVFANDADLNVRNKIFVASYIETTTHAQPIISLSLAADGDVSYLDQVQVTKGETYGGHTVWFDGSNWIDGQFKETINQPPKFDIFDANGISYSDNDFYTSNDFDGCSLFEYAPTSGVDDPVLGFPIKYSSVKNLGDVAFNVSLNTQTFNYVDGTVSKVGNVREGYVYKYTSRTDYTRQLGWQTAVEQSFQYQVFNFVCERSAQTYRCDVAALTANDTKWKSIVVYVNNTRQPESAYTVIIDAKSTVITLNDSIALGSTVDVMIYSDQASSTGYYQIPNNLDHNPLNKEITDINFGDIRGHYKSICNNLSALVGDSFGANNYRDLGNVVPYGTRLIQTSAPLVSAGIFIRNKDVNILNAIDYNSLEYTKFKSLLVDTINRTDFYSLQDNASILDSALIQIANSKSDSNPFFWSDMIPSKNPSATNTYTFNVGITTSEFNLSRVYDFKNANYYSLLVYLTRKIDGTSRTVQLIRDIDYVVSDTQAQLTVTKDLLQGDILVVKEYNQTYGNFVPNTPSKLGLYPKFVPEVIYDTSYVNPTYFIKGHDGSLTRLYGSYNNGYLEDFRDRALFEFETRIYNNIKVDAVIPVQYDDIFPGAFRTTDYTTDDLTQMYNASFLNWIGVNRIDYTSQTYIDTNEWTWNYRGSKTKTGTKVTQGNWRGIYLWYYDTSTPHSTPWEMLGLTSKPSWWDTRYGEAPYTSENTLLWTDLRDGYVYNDGASYVNEKRKRPNLLEIIPVDVSGRLKAPIDTMINSYNVETLKNKWESKDVSPVEFTYLKSSSWPFDLMKIAALTHPAIFFSLGLDLDAYKYNTEFGQYLVNNRTRGLIDPATLYFYGTNSDSASNSYVNWVVDYMTQYGVNSAYTIRDLFLNVDVQLAYRMAGFSDKDMLKFFVEKGSTEGTSTSLMIPDESYSILLYENEPSEIINYSSVIVQKTVAGFKVYGNSQTKAYFTVQVPIINGNLNTVTVNNVTVKLNKDFTSNTQIVPYGAEFTNVTDLCNFLINYGKFLTIQGMLFNDIENGLELSWEQMVAETVYWVQSGWEIGSTVNVNPCANQISIQRDSLIVQPLTLNRENYILNQNLIPIQLKDLYVYRNETLFNAKVLNPGDSVSYLNAKLSNIEHIVIFANKTSFNDLIFNPITSLRQQRLYVKGAKTAEWNGTMNAAGFIINENNVKEWEQNKKYTKGIIVKYKNKYWISQEIIAPAETFDTTKWIVTDYDKIKTGLLPNASNRAFESTVYYDANRGNLENDGDLLGFSLIGYRPREYMVNADLDDVSQVNVYKNMLGAKGTPLAASGLNNIAVQQNTLSYDVYENWAIKSFEYGGLLTQNFVEFTLEQNKLVGNPAVASLIIDSTVPNSHQQTPLYKLKNYGRQIVDPKILPTTSTFEEKLPNAGYVNLDDVSATGYNINKLDDTMIGAIYKGEYIWVADNLNTWNVYSMSSMDNVLVEVFNNLNGTATFTFEFPHSLTKYDSIGVLNFSSDINGYYEIDSINDLYSVIVSVALPASISTLKGTGLPFKLQYQRVGTARDIELLPVVENEYSVFRVWVDKNTQGNWTVYEKKNRYVKSDFRKIVSGTSYGASVCYIENLGYLVSDPGVNKLYQYIKDSNNRYILFKTYEPPVPCAQFGTTLVHSDKFVIVSDSNPDAYGNEDPSHMFVYKITYDVNMPVLTLDQTIRITDSRFGDAMAISGDSNYLYSNILDYGIVAPYQLDTDFVYDEQRTWTAYSYQLTETASPTSTTIVVSGNATVNFSVNSYIVLDIGDTGEGNEVSRKITNLSYLPGPTPTTVITVDKAFGYGATTSDYVVKVNPMTLATATVVNQNKFVVSGDWVDLIPEGKYVSFTDSGYADVYTVITSEYNATDDTTIYYVIESLKHSYVTGTKVSTASYQFSLIMVYTSTDYLMNISDDITGGQNSFKVSGNKTGIASSTVTFTNYDSYTIASRSYDSGSNKTTFVVNDTINYSYSAGTVATFVISDLLTTGTAVADQFGFALATNYDGSKLFISAPKWNYSINKQDVGSTWVYDRIIFNLEAQSNGVSGAQYVFTSSILLDPGARVYLNSRLLKHGEYLIAVNRVGVSGDLVKAGDIITVSTGRFVVTEQLLGFESESDIIPGEQYGYSLASNKEGGELLVGSPYNIHDLETQGAVYRHTNGDKRFGTKAGVIAANLIDPTYIYINGYTVNAFNDITFTSTVSYGSTSVTLTVADAQKIPDYGTLSFHKTDTGNTRDIAYTSVNRVTGEVTFSVAFPYSITFEAPISYLSVPLGNATNIANKINNSNITNVFAYSTEDNRLVIRLRDSSLNPVNNKLNVTVLNGNYLYQMGFQSTYTKTQIIRNPYPEKTGLFGYKVDFNEYNSFLVSAPLATRHTGTTFDFTDDANYHNDTVFDNGFTAWVDTVPSAGAVYMYDYINTYDEALDANKIGKFFLAQSINDLVATDGTSPMYGSAISFNGYTAMVGAPEFNVNGEHCRVVVYENIEYVQNWKVAREYTNVVDTNKIQKVELYNNVNNETLIPLDYFDPLEGKLLSVVNENLDFISSNDPAGYSNPSVTKGNSSWGKGHVGTLWFDTSTTRFINYHQNDVKYDSQYWGAIFPGSEVSIYSWIESDTPPSAYAGLGTVYDVTKFSVAFNTDANAFVYPKYYYWVKNTNIVNTTKNKTLSDSVIQSYITQPQNSGIAYFAPVSAQSFALYNAADYIKATDTNIHIGFNTSGSDSSKHEEYKLIRAGHADDFLPGVPNQNAGQLTPESLYDRFLDSLSGTDDMGLVVPDPYLPAMLQTGVSTRPRQSLFVNRFKALENYFTFVNSVIAKYPITEIGNASYLSANGEFYNVMSYWSFIYWWADGYSNSTKTAFEVQAYADLSTINPIEGLIVGVAKNGQGKREVYTFKASAWVRIGLEDGTIEFSDLLWNYSGNRLGYGDNYFDTVPFDEYPSVETRFILRALNEQIFVNELLPYKNEGLILMFEYIQSENIDRRGYLPWLNKTSFIDIDYLVRDLVPYDKYRDDNQTLLEGFIEEVKPYRVVIKEFTMSYTGMDVYNTGYSDFDLPAEYNSSIEKFVSPKLVINNPDNQTTFGPTSDIWTSNEYTGWFNNYGIGFYSSPNVEVCSLTRYITTSDSKMYVDNAKGLPESGQFTLNGEIIGYASVNREYNVINGLSRGLYNSIPIEHYVSEKVVMDLPPVIVTDPGSRYTGAPEVTAWIDTSIYPEPRTPAKLRAVIGDNKVIAIDVLDSGSGYVVTPEIRIDYSYKVSFASTSVDFTQSTITLTDAEFTAGELVKFTSSGVNGILDDGYYYVNIIQSLNTLLAVSNNLVISLHRKKSDAIDDRHRVRFYENKKDVPNTYYIGISAFAFPNLAGNKVRSLAETIRFDRTSYQPKVEEWTPSTFWSSPYKSLGNDASSSDQLYYSRPIDVEVDSGWVSPSGGTGAEFTVYNVLFGGDYYVELNSSSTGGTGYNIGDVITIPGDILLGSTPVNDCFITVTDVGAENDIIDFTVSGTAVDSYAASLQGAVIPVTSISSTTGNYTAVTLNFNLVHMKPGQLKGAKSYFYRREEVPPALPVGNTLESLYYYDDAGISFIGEIEGTTLTVTSIYNNPLNQTLDVGSTIKGNQIFPGTEITALGTGTGGVGTYTINNGTASFTGSISEVHPTPSETVYYLDVTAVSSGTLAVGEQIIVAGNTDVLIITELGTGSGLTGTYKLSGATQEVASTSMTSMIPTRAMNTNGGAFIYIYKPRFNPTSISNQYTMKIVDPGFIYSANQTIVIPGAELNGVTGVNDAMITVDYITLSGGIYFAKLEGTPVTQYDVYYLNPISGTKVEIYKDPGLTSPVGYPIIYDGLTNLDYVFIPEPIISSLAYKFEVSSLVVYNGNIWRCIDSNNDAVFDVTKWEKLSSDDRSINALDRISAYYEPTAGMIGKNYSQLLSGVSYPNNVYKGNMFATADQFPVDIILRDLPYSVRGLSIKDMLYDGNQYIGVADGNEGTIIITSSDFGENWEFHVISKQRLEATSITYDTERYLITCDNTVTPILISYDGLNWTTIGEYTPYDSTAYDVSAFDTGAVTSPLKSMFASLNYNGLSIIVGDNIIADSTNYSQWEESFKFNTRLVNYMKRVQYVESNHFVGYLIVGRSDVIVSGENTAAPDIQPFTMIMTSPDGVTWTPQLPHISQTALNAIAFNSSAVVIGGEHSAIFVSMNGHNWQAATYTATPDDETINAMVYGNGKFVAVGTNGFVAVSTDGQTFTQVSSPTTHDFYNIFFDSETSRFIAIGSDDTILRSANGLAWADISYIDQTLSEYEIVGDGYQAGYGPEELVAGNISDSLNMRVVTSPGSYWDNDTVNQDFWYYNTGFGMVSDLLTPDNLLSVSFAGFIRNPATLSVFIMDTTTNKSRRIYETASVNNLISYSVDWVQQTITLDQAINANEKLFVEVYDIGNGRQLISGNTLNYPLQVDPETGKSIFVSDITFQEIVTDPVMYVNGTKLVYNTDYFIEYTEQNTFKIRFTELYDTTVDYIVGAILDTTITSYNTVQFGYSIPDTELFVGNGGTEYTTSLNVGGTNPDNMVVEVNGYRLVPYPISGYDYTLSGNVITLTSSISSDDILAITTYNETRRLWSSTVFSQTLTVTQITEVFNTLPATFSIEFADPSHVFADGDLVRIDGVNGSTGLNGNTYYVKDVTVSGQITTYELYNQYDSGTFSQPVDGGTLGVYISEGYVWKDSMTVTVTAPAITTVFPSYVTGMPAITYSQNSKSWATVDGYRIDSSKVIFREDNKLSICVPMAAGSNYILTTVFADGKTPEEESFNLTVDKTGYLEVYRTNITDGTWLTEELSSASTVITVNDVTRLVHSMTSSALVETDSGSLIAYLAISTPEVKTIKLFTVDNVTTGETGIQSNGSVELVNGRPAIIFTSGVTVNDSLSITLYLGETVQIGSERVYFGSIDLETNTLSGLIRGINGTTETVHPIYSMSYGVNNYVRLGQQYNGVLWNSFDYNTKGDPLQLSSTASARFLAR